MGDDRSAHLTQNVWEHAADNLLWQVSDEFALGSFVVEMQRSASPNLVGRS